MGNIILENRIIFRFNHALYRRVIPIPTNLQAIRRGNKGLPECGDEGKITMPIRHFRDAPNLVKEGLIMEQSTELKALYLRSCAINRGETAPKEGV